MSNNPYQATEHTATPSTNEISESELFAFAGGKHYPRVLLNMLEGKKQHGGFNIWAALFSVNWYFYRKLYMFGLFALALEMVAPLMAVWAFGSLSQMHPDDLWAVAVMVCFVVVRIGIGYMANIALCLKAVSVIHAVDRLNKDNAAHLRLIKADGGISMVSLFSIYILLQIYSAMR